jgi:hypothetical protein
MKLVFETSAEGDTFIGFTKDEALAEAMVLEKFQEVALEGDELVRIEQGGTPIFTIRKPEPAPEPDDFEYVDNEGNPITSEGLDILDSDEITSDSTEPSYIYDGDFIWGIWDGEEGKSVRFPGTELYLLTQGPTNPFEEDENLVVVTTA